MKSLKKFGLVILLSIAFAQWGMGFLALYEDEYMIYQMRDPLANIQYLIGVAKENDALKWIFTFLSNHHPVKSTDFTPGQGAVLQATVSALSTLKYYQ